jgi:type IV pilus assembly protein PilY1
LYSSTYAPTDSDIALGYRKFGKRLAFIYVGRTWYANTSPGGGYLQVPVGDNQSNNQHRDALLEKLQTFENDATGYMSCPHQANPNQCSYIVNAGLTPTAGTLQTVISYFQGGTTPIQATAADCQKSFIAYVTDGLPSVDENGGQGDAGSLMPAVMSKLQALRSLPVSIGGKAYTYDLRTYIVGRLTSEAGQADQMVAAAGTDINGHAYHADSAEQLRAPTVFTDGVSVPTPFLPLSPRSIPG